MEANRNCYEIQVTPVLVIVIIQIENIKYTSTAALRVSKSFDKHPEPFKNTTIV